MHYEPSPQGDRATPNTSQNNSSKRQSVNVSDEMLTDDRASGRYAEHI